MLLRFQLDLCPQAHDRCSWMESSPSFCVISYSNSSQEVKTKNQISFLHPLRCALFPVASLFSFCSLLFFSLSLFSCRLDVLVVFFWACCSVTGPSANAWLAYANG